MKVEWVPKFYNPNTDFAYPSETIISFVDENNITVDGETYTFDPACVSWPTIAKDTNYVILSAMRDTELHLTVRRFTTSSNSPPWDDGKEHDLASS